MLSLLCFFSELWNVYELKLFTTFKMLHEMPHTALILKVSENYCVLMAIHKSVHLEW